MLKWETESGDITTINLMSNTHLENAIKQKQRQLKDSHQDKDREKRFKRIIAILKHETNIRLQLGINIFKTMYLPEDDIDDEERWTEHFWSMDDN